MKKDDIRGCYPAMVTPFTDNGEIDFPALNRILDNFCKSNVTGVVVAGTTGESSTLSHDEHKKLIEWVVYHFSGQFPVIAGTGANNTAEAIELTRHAKKVGADATLQVAPYYNKPTSEGMRQHFLAVAEVGLPVILYNVPGRCGVPIPVNLVAELSKHENIIAIKEAGGDINRVHEILKACDITVLSGDDGLTFPMMALGAKGVISVAANFMPERISELLVKSALNGNWSVAQEEAKRLHGIFLAMFLETNPIPVKTVMAKLGMIKEVFRLPMCSMQPKNRDLLMSIIKPFWDIFY